MKDYFDITTSQQGDRIRHSRSSSAETLVATPPLHTFDYTTPMSLKITLAIADDQSYTIDKQQDPDISDTAECLFDIEDSTYSPAGKSLNPYDLHFNHHLIKPQPRRHTQVKMRHKKAVIRRRTVLMSA